MMKKIICGILILILVFAMVGCSQPAGNDKTDNKETQNKTEQPTQEPTEQPDELNMTSKEIMGKITEGIDTTAFSDMDAETFKQLYKLEEGLFENWNVFRPEMTMAPNEVGVFKLKDMAKLDDLKAALAQRAKDLEDTFGGYGPAMAEIAKNYKVEVRGSYVLFAVNSEADKIVAAFKDLK